jgi:hypothetical protein
MLAIDHQSSSDSHNDDIENDSNSGENNNSICHDASSTIARIWSQRTFYRSPNLQRAVMLTAKNEEEVVQQ